jgi:glycerophosphoryl diester phosphodiesterase
MSARSARWCRAADRPLLIAHRGASKTAPENTVEAMRAARAAGADGVEIDVRLCRTGEVVVFHDADTWRLAGRPGRVAARSLAELRGLDLGRGARVATFAEVLEEIGRDLLVDVEIKAEVARDLGLEVRVAAEIRRQGLGRRVMVSSFHPVALWRFQRLMPEIPTGLIFADDQVPPLRWAWPAYLLSPEWLAPQSTLCSVRRLADWHASGFAVNCWVADDPTEARALCAMGADALTSNDPARVRRVLDEVPV